MRNFKRFLSCVLVFTMLLTTVSCLGGVFTFGASADDVVYTDYAGKTYKLGEVFAEGNDHVLSVSEQNAKYDALYGAGTASGSSGSGGWVYLASQSFEVANTYNGEYAIDDYITPTDGYVQPGQLIFTKVTYGTSSGLYIGLPTLEFGFSSSFFDLVTAPLTADVAKLSSSTDNTDLQNFAARMNQDNAIVSGLNFVFKLDTLASHTDITINPTTPTASKGGGLTTDQLLQIGAIRGSAYTIDTDTCFKADGSKWLFGYLLKVKDAKSDSNPNGLEEGDSGAIFIPRELYKRKEGTKNYVAVANQNKVAYSSTKTVGTASSDNACTMTFVTDDFGCAFVIGGSSEQPDEPQQDDEWAVAAGECEIYNGNKYPTGEIFAEGNDHVLSVTEQNAKYDALYGAGTPSGSSGSGGWVYLASQSFEVADTYNGEYAIDDYITPTDGFVLPGQLVFTKVTYGTSSGLYIGLPTLEFGFSSSFFDLVTAPLTADVAKLSSTTNNTDLQNFAARMNQDNAIVSGLNFVFKLDTLASHTDITINPTTPTASKGGGLTTDQLLQIGAIRGSAYTIDTDTCFKADGSKWLFGYLLKVKDAKSDDNPNGVEKGDTGAIFIPRELYKRKEGTKNFVAVANQNKVAYSSTKTVGTASSDNACTMTFITEDFGCSFIIGAPGTPGGDDDTFTATFMNGTDTFTTQSNVSAATDPGAVTAAAGKNFIGWALTEGGATVEFPYTLTANTTFYAVFEDAAYTLTINYSGAGAATPAAYTSDYAYGASYSVASPVVTGYTPDKAVVSGTITADTTVNVVYTANKYNVKWYDGSTLLKTDTNVAFGSDIARYNYTKGGYTLAGWSLTNGGATVTFPYKMTAGDLSFYAKFTANTHTITWNDKNGTSQETLSFGDAITARTPAEKPGYTCSGWDNTVPATMPDSNLTFNAVYTPVYRTVTFYLDAEKTQVYDQKTDYVYDDIAYAPATFPTWADGGKSFAGWVDANGIAAKFPFSVGTTDEEFFATWTPKKFSVSFIDADGNDIDGYVSIQAEYGTLISDIAPAAEDIPAVAGKTFVGWYITEDYETCDLDQPAGTVLASSQIYMAYYAEAQLTVSFYNGTEKVGTFTGAEGATINAPEVDIPEGYDFDGWYDAAEGGNKMPATLTTDGANYYARFKAHEYRVEYYVNDQLVHVDLVPYLGTIPAYTYTEEGYEIGAWDYVPETVDGPFNIIVRATKTAKNYTLTINYAGAGAATPAQYTAQVAYGTEYKVTSPTVNGYTPDKAVVEGTMGAGDLTVTVTYAAGVHAIKVSYTGAGKNTPAAYQSTAAYGESYSVTSPAVEGYTPDVAVVEGTMGENDVEVLVTYTINTHTITYIIEGVAEAPVSYTFGESLATHADPVKEGNKFTGWAPEVPATMPDKDLEVVAQFAPETYTLTWVVDGVETAIDYTYGAEVAEFAGSTDKEGYTFKGWDAEKPATMPARDVTITAKYDVNSYTAKFVVDGVTVQEGLVAFGTVPTKPATPNKAGYTFTGWNPAVEAMPAHDVTYTAQFDEADGVKYTVNTYTMNFDGTYGDADVVEKYAKTNAAVDAAADELEAGLYYDTEAEGYNATGTVAADGSLVLDVYIGRTAYDLTFSIDGKDTTTSVRYGAPITAPEALKEGYSFTSWNTTVPATMPAGDRTYVAQFSINTYTIKWNYNNTSKTNSYVFGTAVTAPDPTMTGYTFTGWDKDVPATMTAGNLEITAQYTINKYTIKYLVEGEEYTSQTYDYNADVTAPDAPEVEGKDFSGWNPALPDKMPAKNLEVNAQFGINSYTFTYVVDGKTTSKTYAFGASIPAIATPTKAGYTFNGWDGGEWPTTMPAGDLTLTAKWVVNEYTLTYVVDGVKTEEKYDYNEAITAIADPAKEGYTFTGWNPSVPATMPANDYTVTATWSVKSYNAAFIIDGATKNVSANYGVAPVAPAAEKEGYKFLGWYVTGDETQTVLEALPAMGAADASYTAKFEINSYNAIFDCNGGNIDGQATVTVPTVYGEEIVVPADPERTGFIFQGWSPVPGTMGASDTTFTAQWANDLSICSIQSVERSTTPYYENGYATYVVTVKGSPIKINFASTSSQASWTYDRNLDKVAADAEIGGVVSITDNGETGDALVETWTIRIMLPEGTYKVRAKLNYTESSWEDKDTAYEFVNTYDEKPAVTPETDKIKSVSVDKNTVVRGDYAVWTVVADKSVAYLMFADPNGENTVSFSKSLSSVSITENEDGDNVWTITTRMTYVDAAQLSQDQEFTFKYRGASELEWTESAQDSVTVTVTKYDDSAAVKSEEYDSYSVVEATAIAGKKLAFTPITIKTTKDVTKLRFTIGTKTATYTESSANTTVAADPDDENLIIWTIGYRFLTAGDYTVQIESRGNAWTGEYTNVNVKIFATQAEADEYNDANTIFVD